MKDESTPGRWPLFINHRSWYNSNWMQKDGVKETKVPHQNMVQLELEVLLS